MKRFIFLLCVAASFAVSAAYAQTRVKFPAGRNSVTLKGKTTGGPSESGGMNPKSYVLHARKGQTMNLQLTSAKKNAVFGIYTPKMEDLIQTDSKTSWSGVLTKTGNYEIMVFPEDEVTDTTFTLIITIK